MVLTRSGLSNGYHREKEDDYDFAVKHIYFPSMEDIGKETQLSYQEKSGHSLKVKSLASNQIIRVRFPLSAPIAGWSSQVSSSDSYSEGRGFESHSRNQEN